VPRPCYSGSGWPDVTGGITGREGCARARCCDTFRTRPVYWPEFAPSEELCFANPSEFIRGRVAGSCQDAPRGRKRFMRDVGAVVKEWTIFASAFHHQPGNRDESIILETLSLSGQPFPTRAQPGACLSTQSMAAHWADRYWNAEWCSRWCRADKVLQGELLRCCL
jgi:hypothetical protein